MSVYLDITSGVFRNYGKKSKSAQSMEDIRESYAADTAATRKLMTGIKIFITANLALKPTRRTDRVQLPQHLLVL
jgi:hypothetical protein